LHAIDSPMARPSRRRGGLRSSDDCCRSFDVGSSVPEELLYLFRPRLGYFPVVKGLDHLSQHGLGLLHSVQASIPLCFGHFPPLLTLKAPRTMCQRQSERTTNRIETQTCQLGFLRPESIRRPL